MGEVTLTATRSDGNDGVTANRQKWRFGYVAGGGVEYQSNRFGGFLQASYRFLD